MLFLSGVYFSCKDAGVTFKEKFKKVIFPHIFAHWPFSLPWQSRINIFCMLGATLGTGQSPCQRLRQWTPQPFLSAVLKSKLACYRDTVLDTWSQFSSDVEEADKVEAVAKIPLGLMFRLSIEMMHNCQCDTKSHPQDTKQDRIVIQLVYICIICNNVHGRILLREIQRKVKLLHRSQSETGQLASAVHCSVDYI